MPLDRRRALDAFAAYAARYNDKDPKVRLKIDHTYRVAALCGRIARAQGLDAPGLDLAWLCGLLHDVGRFEQLRRYGTFNDAASIDHAACSVQVLFDEGHIRDYLPDPDQDALLRTAVACHSAYRLPGGLDARTLLYCNILRDADKIDILRVNVRRRWKKFTMSPPPSCAPRPSRRQWRRPFTPTTRCCGRSNAPRPTMWWDICRWCTSWSLPKAAALCGSRAGWTG